MGESYGKRWVRWFGKVIIVLVVLPLAFLVVSNWFVHQPREWRSRVGRYLPRIVYHSLIGYGHAFANYTDAVGWTGSDIMVALEGYEGTNAFLFAGEPRRIEGGVAPDDVYVLEKEAFLIGWSPSKRHPVWAAYRIPPTDDPFVLPRLSYFWKDMTATNSAVYRDYLNSGYDRGHMVPNHAIATRYGPTAQRETFMMSNVAPQRPWLNRGPWADVEHRAAKHWAQLYGDVWVIVGTIPSYRREESKLECGVAIPHAFYQIAVNWSGEELKACAVIMPQRIWMRAKPRIYLASIREIERQSGFDFFSMLPDAVESELEEGLPTRLWPSGWRGLRDIVNRQRGIYDWME